ncbi:MAG TPA: DNA mismatch repair endonuclease MutL [candidate division Zixibacteria bacterium]|nr:DNA mismatch repair endonuclease MutL [candidate division Zixibacteria bacterium]
MVKYDTMSILILSEQVASQIAAGEVVERPASVVKELVENAIDAGAKTVNIDIRGGGRQLVQVADDGLGIPADEIEVAFKRHSTSKLAEAEDLETIETLGFRGEALAAISSVSQLTIVSRTQEDSAGTRLTIEAGVLTNRESVGAPHGTVIAVANMFYNVPARLKFLKSVTTEKKHIDEIVTRYAMAYPGIRFRLTHDNRITFQSSGGNLLDVLTSIYGSDTAKQLLELREQGRSARQMAGRMSSSPHSEPIGEINSLSSIRVSGFIGPPGLNWSNRNQITLYVNGRWIKDNRLNYAVIQAYHTLLPVGRYPLAVAFVTTAPENVDVNVHPAKTEVRFRQANAVFGALQRTVRQTLISDSPIPHATHFSSVIGQDWVGTTERQAPIWQTETALPGGRGFALDSRLGTQSGEVGPDGQQIESADGVSDDGVSDDGNKKLPIMRVVGQVGASYIITEGPDGLYLIDQHAAHERVLYEKFMADWEEKQDQEGMISQGLVNGVTVRLSPAQSTLLEGHLRLMDRIGFQIEPFGPNAYMVRSVPALLTKIDPARALLDVVEDMERGDAPLQGKIEARIILRVCKSAAVKAGQALGYQEMEAMIRQLEQCQNPHTCPHGRPTLIHLSASQLAKEFGRT